MNNISVTALILVVSQTICFTVVIWLRSSRDLGTKSPRTSFSRNDPVATNLGNLMIENIKPPKHSKPGNMDGYAEMQKLSMQRRLGCEELFHSLK